MGGMAGDRSSALCVKRTVSSGTVDDVHTRPAGLDQVATWLDKMVTVNEY